MAQLGVLKVLERAGIPVSYAEGTSAGAIIGAVYFRSACGSPWYGRSSP
jgi:predicted acylesterase/phospholipase RssA